VRIWVASGSAGSADANAQEDVVEITGTHAAVQAAADAVSEFIRLNPPPRVERVSVPAAARRELIGKDGANIRALQGHHGVRINVPKPQEGVDAVANIEVTVSGTAAAGLEAAVAEIRGVGDRVRSQDKPQRPTRHHSNSRERWRQLVDQDLEAAVVEIRSVDDRVRRQDIPQRPARRRSNSRERWRPPIGARPSCASWRSQRR